MLPSSPRSDPSAGFFPSRRERRGIRTNQILDTLELGYKRAKAIAAVARKTQRLKAGDAPKTSGDKSFDKSFGLLSQKATKKDSRTMTTLLDHAKADVTRNGGGRQPEID